MVRQLYKKMLSTDENSYSLFFLRVVAAIVIFPHGAQKLFGWFGGYGFDATINAFSAYLGIPPFLALLNILTESAGAVLLLGGLFSRFTAFALSVTMVVAASTHLANGFFMNWTGTAAGEGFEYHLLYLAISLVILIKGGGAFAIDSILLNKTAPSLEKNYELQKSL